MQLPKKNDPTPRPTPQFEPPTDPKNDIIETISQIRLKKRFIAGAVMNDRFQRLKYIPPENVRFVHYHWCISLSLVYIAITCVYRYHWCISLSLVCIAIISVSRYH